MSSLSYKFFKNNSRGLPRVQSRGFTLVEMMVVVSIIIIMTGVVLAGLPGFRDRSSLDLVAQEVALVIRQAQAFGSQTRFAATAFPSYGIYFNINDINSAFKFDNSFRLFADNINNNERFDDVESVICATSGSECREVYNLSGGITISDYNVCSSTSCVSPSIGGVTTHKTLNIVFKRPNPEAKFVEQNGTNLDASCGGSCSYAKITLSSPKVSNPRNICVWSTGHIYVTANSSC